MKKIVVLCRSCRSPVELPRRQFKAWVEKAGLPFVCDACLGKEMKKAVQTSDIAKAEAHTRAFQTINLNPTTHETRTHPTQQPRP